MTYKICMLFLIHRCEINYPNRPSGYMEITKSNLILQALVLRSYNYVERHVLSPIVNVNKHIIANFCSFALQYL